MDERQFAEFFTRRGCRVVTTPSSHWVEIHPFCFQNIPYYQAINPTKEELNKLFFRKLAIIVRYLTLSSAGAAPAYLWVCRDKDYNFHQLESKSRNQTRRGLENTTVTRLSFAYLARHGLPLVQDTTRRQGREPDFSSPREWEKFCDSAARIPDFEAWGAYVGEALAAFLVGAHINEYYNILYQYSKTELLKYYSNNALVYRVTKHKLEDPSVRVVSYGLDSVENTAGLDRFKTGMGYGRRKIYQKILVNPVAAPWLKNPKGKRLLSKLLPNNPRNNYWRKARAILDLLTQ